MDPQETETELNISLEKAFYIIVKAREFDEKVAPPEAEEPGSNPSDDRDVAILQDYANDATFQELEAALDALNEDEQLDLLALMWFGRGDYDSFEQARRDAQDVRDKHIPAYLMGTPLLGDHLEEGLTQLGYSLEPFEINRL